MNTTRFEYMLALERLGSITKAAEEFFISPSAISQCLKMEEKQWECQLFEQKNRKMVPTQEGLIYLKGARKIVEIREHTLKQLNISFQNRHDIRLAVSPMLFQEIFEKIQPALKTAFSNTGIELLRTDEKTAYAYLLNDLADFALLASPRQNHALLTEEVLGRDRLLLIVPKAYLRHQIIAKPKIEDCRTVPFILTKSGSTSRNIENRILAKHQISQIRIYETDDYLMSRQFLEDGKGAAFLPTSMIPENADKHFFVISPKLIGHFPFLFVWPSDKADNSECKKIAQTIRAAWKKTSFSRLH